MTKEYLLESFKDKAKAIISADCTSDYLHRINAFKDLYDDFLIGIYPSMTESEHSRLQNFWSIIIKCFELHQKGLFVDATQLFYENIFCQQEYRRVSLIAPHTRFYRIRTAEYGTLYDRNGMFHIPTNMRQIVKNERFSISGIPSLYLGDSAYICWEEMGNPNFDTCNISLFVNSSSVSVISLDPIINDFIQKNVLLYPLTYICSFGTRHPNSPYKEEYVIPQILMQCLLIYNNQKQHDHYLGIRYISSKSFNEQRLLPLNEAENLSRFYNYVFPAIPPYNKNGLSEYLVTLFNWSAPTTYDRCRLRAHHFSFEDYPSKTKDTYAATAFYFMEKWCKMMYNTNNVKQEFDRINKHPHIFATSQP